MQRINETKKYQHILGKTYGEWTVLSVSEERASNGNVQLVCKCSCADQTIRLVPVSKLLKGATNSCGCSVKTHGESRTPLYKVWSGIKGRTSNPDNKGYEYAGGRGINMCDEWFNNFETFKEWCSENGYKKGLSLDRIDNDGDFSPSNCRWVDAKTRRNNTRFNRNITIGAFTKTLSQWCEEAGLSYRKVRSRMDIGWSVEEALEIIQKDKKVKPHEIELDGCVYNLVQACERLQLDIRIVRQRLTRNWSMEEALELVPKEKKPPTRTKVVIEGKEYNLKRACEKLGFDYSLAKSRMHRGWSVHEALEFEKRELNHTTHEFAIGGKTYSLTEACKLLNLDYHLVHGRLRKGWSTEEALELVERNIGNKQHEITAIDSSYNLSEACKALNMNYGTVLGRLKLGWSVLEALELVEKTPSPITNYKRVHKIDLNGEIVSLTEACKRLNIGRATVHRRMSKQGISLYEALGIKHFEEEGKKK